MQSADYWSISQHDFSNSHSEQDDITEKEMLSWRRYNARCRRVDMFQSYAALASGTFALHNLSARMHRAEALYLNDIYIFFAKNK